jgi:endothelin-converting enzyme
MNKSVDPCQDFYSYACGGWQKSHPLENNASFASPMDIVTEQNFIVIKEALERAYLKYPQVI